MEYEEIYLIGSKGKDGEYRKLVKCFEHFWFDEKDAIKFFNTELEEDLRPFYAIFKVEMHIDNVTKIIDGKDIKNE